jgi:hypothetical protein
MSNLPVQIAYCDADSTVSYIFSCPHRSYGVIFNTDQMGRLARTLGYSNPSDLFKLSAKDISDNLPVIVDETSQEQELLNRGWSIASISETAQIHPVELAMYFSAIGYMERGTMQIILKLTANEDIPLRESVHYSYQYKNVSPVELGIG